MMILYKFVWDLSLIHFTIAITQLLSWINFFSYQTQYKKLENNFSTSQKGNIQSVMMRNFESNFNALILRIPIPSQSSYAFFSFWKYVWLLFTLSSFGILLYVLLDLLFSWREKLNFKTWIIVKLYWKITAKCFLWLCFLFSIWYKWLHYKYLSTWT